MKQILIALLLAFTTSTVINAQKQSSIEKDSTENEFTRFFYRIYPRFVGRRRIRKTGFRLAAGTSREH